MATNTLRGRRASWMSTLAAACVCGLLVAPGAAHAVPQKDSAAVQDEIVQAQHDIEVIAEEYNAAKIELAELNEAAQEAQAELADATAEVKAAQAEIADAGVSLYQSAAPSSATTIISGSSPQDVIDRLSTLSQISQYHQESVQALQESQAKADAAAAEADAAVTAAAKVESDLADKKTSIEAKLPKLQEQLDALTKDERDAVLAQAGGHATGEDGNEPVKPKPGTGGSVAAQGAVDAALSRQGMPYVWAAAGPSAFDCSGLTMWAYAQVGISLPHQSEQQAAAGQSVPVSQALPGDIMWMPGHVGLYIGNGQVVHAPTSGDVVKVVPVGSMGWQSAVRIV